MRLAKALWVVREASVASFIRTARILISEGNVIYCGPLVDGILTARALYALEIAVVSESFPTNMRRTLKHSVVVISIRGLKSPIILALPLDTVIRFLILS